MSSPSVLFYVQHLLGIGHLRRAVTVAEAMSEAGLQVTLVSGGMPVAGLSPRVARWVQLPPAAAADLSFRDLVDAQGRPVDDAWRAARVQTLLQAFATAQPDALLIELFPFGRRQMRFELLPLLEAAHARQPRPWILSSVRDVLGAADPAKQQRMQALFDAWFDRVLVHGDPALIPFDTTYGLTPALGERLHYTGYVVDRPTDVPVAADGADGEVLVSAGGGAVGQRLLETAIAARVLSVAASRRWRVLAGLNASDADLARLQALAGSEAEGIVVERHRSDFVARLAHCALSISQAGYNTTLEVLASGAPSVMVPFAGGRESEQTLRTDLLAQRGWVEHLPESELSAERLAKAVDRALARPRRAQPIPIDLQGAARSAERVLAWIRSGAPAGLPGKTAADRPMASDASLSLPTAVVGPGGRVADNPDAADAADARAWQALAEELDHWQALGRTAAFWWRDDDAGAPSEPLDQLLRLAGEWGVPLALAAIPDLLQAEALRQAGPSVWVLQHGVDHRNRAAAGDKKTEFAPAEARADAIARLRAGHERLLRVAPERVLPVLVPPWNRLSAPGLAQALPQAGLRGLSRFGARAMPPTLAGVTEVNTHVDIIDWRGTRGFAGDAVCLAQALAHLQARRMGRVDPDEPTGWLTHHAVHDAPAWRFMHRLLSFTAARSGVHWVLPGF